jgi:hypothetical protein
MGGGPASRGTSPVAPARPEASSRGRGERPSGAGRGPLVFCQTAVARRVTPCCADDDLRRPGLDSVLEVRRITWGGKQRETSVREGAGGKTPNRGGAGPQAAEEPRGGQGGAHRRSQGTRPRSSPRCPQAPAGRSGGDRGQIGPRCQQTRRAPTTALAIAAARSAASAACAAASAIEPRRPRLPPVPVALASALACAAPGMGGKQRTIGGAQRTMGGKQRTMGGVSSGPARVRSGIWEVSGELGRSAAGRVRRLLRWAAAGRGGKQRACSASASFFAWCACMIVSARLALRRSLSSS